MLDNLPYHAYLHNIKQFTFKCLLFNLFNMFYGTYTFFLHRFRIMWVSFMRNLWNCPPFLGKPWKLSSVCTTVKGARQVIHWSIVEVVKLSDKKLHTLSFTCKISLVCFFTLQEIYGLDTLHKLSWVKVSKKS